MVVLRFNEDGSKETVLSVVIPAFNEERTLSEIVQRTQKTLRSLGMPYEIIVMDDGSTDRTAETALQNGVVVISTSQNKGKGYAMRLGIEKTTGSIVITMDADGSHQPEEIPKLLLPILEKNPGSPVVIGSRFMGCIEEEAISRMHFIGNKVFTFLIRMFTGTWITDSQSGFRAYKRGVLKKLNIKSERFEIETEMILKVLKAGFSVKEVPITCKRRIYSNSRLQTFRDGFKILKTIFASLISLT